MAINFAPGFLTRGGSFLDPALSWTIALWARPHTSTPPGGSFRQYYNFGGGGSYIYLGSNYASNDLILEVSDGTNYYDSAIASLSLGAWASITATYDASTHLLTLYKNNTVVGTLTHDLSAFPAFVATERVSTWGDHETAYIRLWQAALSPAEITAEANAPLARRTANLLADTPLFTASDAADYSGHGNHWTPSGTLSTAATSPLPTTITRVQTSGEQHGANQTVLVLPLPTAPVLGNSLVILLTNYRSSPNFPSWTCVDPYGNTYRHAGGTALGSIGASIWYCPVITATGPGFTVTLTATGNCYWVGSVIELAASHGLALDQIALLTGPSGPSPGATLPPLAGPDAVLAAVMTSGATQASMVVAAASPAWVEEHEELSFSVYVPGEGVTRLLGPATSTTPSVGWTVPTSNSWAVVLAAFKPGGTVDTQRADTVTVTDRVFAGFLPPVVLQADALVVTEAVTAQRTRPATVLTQPNWAAGFVFGAGSGVFTPMGWSNLQIVGEADCPFRMDQGGTVRRLAVLQNVAPGSGASRTFTFRKNGVDQAVVVTLGPTDTYQTDETHSFTVAAGDIVVIRVSGTGSPPNTNFSVVWDFEPTANIAHYAIGGSVSNVSFNGPLFMSPFSGGTWTAAGPTQGDTLVGVAGVVTQYRIALTSGPGVGRTRTFVWVKNSIVQDGTGGTVNTTIVFTGTTTLGALVCALPVAEGDLVHVRMVTTGSPASSYVIGAHSFAPSAPHEIPLAGACTANSPISNATSYAPGIGDTTFNTVELQAGLPAPLTNLTLRRLRVRMEVATTQALHNYTLRRNLAATPQTVAVLPSATSAGPSAGADVPYVFGDVLTLQAVVGGISSSVRPHWAVAAESLIAGAMSVSVADTVAATDSIDRKVRPTIMAVVRIEGLSLADDLEVRQQSAHLLTAIVRDTVRVREDTASPGWARGLTRVQVTPRVQTTFSTTVSVTFAKPPSVGNAIVLMVGGYGSAVADAGTGSDTRGNPYLPGPAASNTASGNFARIFYAPAIRASGTPFTVTATFGTSNPRWAIAIEVQSNGWGLVLDQLAANDLQAISPPTPVLTGATPPLTAADAFLAALFSVGGTTFQYNVVTPATPVWRQETEGLVTDGAGEANTRIVSEALGTTPSCQWHIGTTSVWPAAVLAAFKTGSALIMLTGTVISVRLAETVTARDVPLPLRRPVPMNITVAEFVTTREVREQPLPPSQTPQVLTAQGIRVFDPQGGPGARTDIGYDGPWPSGEFTACFWAQGWGDWLLEDGWYIRIEGVDYPYGLMLRCWSGGENLQMPIDDRWHHVTVISRTTGVTLAVDRSQITIPLPTLPPYDYEGFSGTAGSQPAGNMALAYYRMWDAVLTPAELQQERVARRAVRTANLWRDTPFEDGSLLDVSGHVRDWYGNVAVPNDIVYGEPLPWVAEGVTVWDAAAAIGLAPNDRFAVDLVRTTDGVRIHSPRSRAVQDVVGISEVLAVAPFDPRTAKQVRWYTTKVEPTYYPAALRGSWGVVGSMTSGGGGAALKLVNTPMPPYDQFWVYNQYGVNTTAGAAGSTTYCMSHISEPLPAQVISGFINLCHYLKAEKGFTLPNGSPGVGFRLYIYVTVGETDSVRGVLLDYVSPVNGNLWPSASRWWQLDADALLTPVALQTGDRVVIEWGFIARAAYVSDTSQICYFVTTQDRRNDGVPKPIGTPVSAGDAPLAYGYSGYIDFKSGIFVNPIIARPYETISTIHGVFRSGPGPLNRLVFEARTVSDSALRNFALPTGHSGTDAFTVTDSVTGYLQQTRSVHVSDPVTVTSEATLSDIGAPPPIPALSVGVFERVRVAEDRLRSVTSSKAVVKVYDYVTTIDAKTLAIYGTVWDGSGTPPEPTTETSGDYWIVGI